MKSKPTTRNSASLLCILALGLSSIASASEATETTLAPASPSFDLESFSNLTQAFNEESGNVRLVALLSASCGYCIKGYRYMRKLLDDIPDPRLKMLIAWEPMLSGDTRALSLKMAKKEQDPRMVYQAWDEARITGDTYTAVLSANDDRWTAGDGTAWDVYFLYEGDVTWSPEKPEIPTYWQHQGAGQPEFFLNYTNLKAEIEKRLAELPSPSPLATSAE